MAREFIVDGRTFPDPDPNRSVEEVKRMMESFFPELANAETREHKKGEDTSYEFVRRVGTKGNKRDKFILMPCPICATDPQIVCPRDVDAQCLHCGQQFCGGHIGIHLKAVHCVSLDLDYCSKR
jgi:PRTRC genetic system protein C